MGSGYAEAAYCERQPAARLLVQRTGRRGPEDISAAVCPGGQLHQATHARRGLRRMHHMQADRADAVSGPDNRAAGRRGRDLEGTADQGSGTHAVANAIW